MKIQLGHNETAVWNGGHYINFYNMFGENYDCISFAWEKNRVSQFEALQAFINYKLEV